MTRITNLTWKTLFRYLGDMDKRAILALVVLLQASVTLTDYMTGPFVHFTLFYLLPICLAGSLISVRLAYLLAFLATLTLSLTLFQGFGVISAHQLIWSTFTNAVIFIAAAYFSQKASVIVAELDEQSMFDALTKANTRRSFFELGNVALAHLRETQRPVSVAFFDLDDFKDVNDNLGHEAGDRLLVAVASSIRKNLRAEDLFGRLGGDEFAILFDGIGSESIEQVVARLMTKVKEAIEPVTTGVTFSVGVVSCKMDKPITMDEAVAMADKAMYESKRTSKNAIRFIVLN